MDNKEQLMEIIKNSRSGRERYHAEDIADHLLENGVVVQPCSLGQTVYRVAKCCGSYVVLAREVLSMTYRIDHFGNGVWEIFTTANDVLGSTVFLSREEAEAMCKWGNGI